MNLPWLAVGSGEHMPVRDEHPATLVLEEEAKEGPLLNQNLGKTNLLQISLGIGIGLLQFLCSNWMLI